MLFLVCDSGVNALNESDCSVSNELRQSRWFHIWPYFGTTKRPEFPADTGTLHFFILAYFQRFHCTGVLSLSVLKQNKFSRYWLLSECNERLSQAFFSSLILWIQHTPIKLAQMHREKALHSPTECWICNCTRALRAHMRNYKVFADFPTVNNSDSATKRVG